MEPTFIEVKTRRRYDSTRRREQALRTRDVILGAARRLLLADGYAATTVAAIADAAGVSVETIYKRFGGKRGLVRAIWEQGLEGAGPSTAERRSDDMQAEESDPHKIIEGWGRFVMEVAPRAAPILLLIRTAAGTDPDAAALLAETDRARIERMRGNARHLSARRGLRVGVSLKIATDVLWLYSSAELYDLLVLRQGWSIDRYGRFVADGMAAALLPPAGHETSPVAFPGDDGAEVTTTLAPMTPGPILRRASVSDADAIDRLMKASIREIFPSFYDARQTEASIEFIGSVDRMLLEDGTYFVADVEGELVACGGWSRRDKLYTGSGDAAADVRLLDPTTKPARIRAMFTRSDWTRRGLGRQVLEACEAAAKAEGFRTLALMATLPGVPLYVSYGFQIIERVEIPMPDGTTIAGAAMERPIA